MEKGSKRKAQRPGSNTRKSKVTVAATSREKGVTAGERRVRDVEEEELWTSINWYFGP